MVPNVDGIDDQHAVSETDCKSSGLCREGIETSLDVGGFVNDVW